MSPAAAAGVPTSLCAILPQGTTAPAAVSAATWAAGRTEPTIRCHWLATAGIAAARGCPCAVTTAQHNTDSVLEPGNGCVITQSHDPGCSLSSATAGDDGVSTRSAAPCPLAANSVTLVSCALLVSVQVPHLNSRAGYGSRRYSSHTTSLYIRVQPTITPLCWAYTLG